MDYDALKQLMFKPNIPLEDSALVFMEYSAEESYKNKKIEMKKKNCKIDSTDVSNFSKMRKLIYVIQQFLTEDQITLLVTYNNKIHNEQEWKLTIKGLLKIGIDNITQIAKKENIIKEKESMTRSRFSKTYTQLCIVLHIDPKC